MSNTVSQANQFASEAVKFSPPAAYMGAKFLGMTPADWVTWLTLIYIIIQLMIVIPKWLKQYGTWFTRRYIGLTLLFKSKDNAHEEKSD